METSIYKYIFKHTAKDQFLLLLLTAGSLPILYATLEIPKIIVNEAIGGQGMPQQLFGIDIDQIAYLIVLSFIFLGLVLLHGGLKYVINVYRGVVGERMLRRFRYELYSRIQRFPLPHFKRTSQGEIIPMITAETEPLGGFIGDSFALPAFQGGMLLTYLTFIFNQDVLLGLAAIVLYPPQIYLIPKLQKKVNELAKRKVQNVRRLADKVGESISGISEIHVNDTSRFERADVSNRLGTTYEIRVELFKRKYFIKFLNNFLAQLTPFFFFSVGGYFVINGELTLGALVAVLTAYKDISPPWKELLKFYQVKEDIRIKYAQIIEQFQPNNMFSEKLLDSEVEQSVPLDGQLVSTRLSYSEDEQVKIIDNVSFKFSLHEHVAIVGLSGSGKEELGMLLARLLLPSGGSVTIGGQDTAHLPESVIGRRMAYVGQNAHIFSGTVRDNLYYGLQHRPITSPEYDEAAAKLRANQIRDAHSSGNSTEDVNADWIDYAEVGAEDRLSLADKTVEILKIPEVDQDVYNLGLFGSVDPEIRPRLAKRILEGRHALRDRLQDPSIARLVESFDESKYNNNMSVAENLLFGTATDARFALSSLATNKQILKVLKGEMLINDFLKIGHRIAEIMVDIFADVPPDSELFEQFSFISAEDLAEFSSLLGRIEVDNLNKVTGQDRVMLLSLPFKLISGRHRLGLITPEIQARLVSARKRLKSILAKDQTCISYFDIEQYNPTISIQDNILFGKIAYGQAHAPARIGQLIREVVDQLDLRKDIIRGGFDYQVGIAGSRLSFAQRQKLAISRCLLKHPDLLIVNDATSGLDPATESKVLNNIKAHMQDRGLIWVLSRLDLTDRFDRIIVMEGGKVVEQGTSAELDTSDSRLNGLKLSAA